MGDAILTHNKLFFYFCGFIRLCLFWWKSIKKCDRESARRRTDRQTDSNRFYNLSHAICYSYVTDNNVTWRWPQGQQRQRWQSYKISLLVDAFVRNDNTSWLQFHRDVSDFLPLQSILQRCHWMLQPCCCLPLHWFKLRHCSCLQPTHMHLLPIRNPPCGAGAPLFPPLFLYFLIFSPFTVPFLSLALPIWSSFVHPFLPE